MRDAKGIPPISVSATPMNIAHSLEYHCHKHFRFIFIFTSENFRNKFSLIFPDQPPPLPTLHNTRMRLPQSASLRNLGQAYFLNLGAQDDCEKGESGVARGEVVDWVSNSSNILFLGNYWVLDKNKKAYSFNLGAQDDVI